MTDDLKDQLRRLVSDPPPPSGVPSENVFARIRTTRRRRAAGVAAGTAAAVVAVVAVATGTFAGTNSAPPITNTPGNPQTIVTGPPTVTPSTTPPTAKTTIGEIEPILPTDTPDSPPPSKPSSPSNTPPPEAEPVKLNLSLTPTVKGMTASVKYDWSGSLLIPINTFTGKTLETDSSKLTYVAYSWDYDFGDGTNEPGTGANGGGLTCKGATLRVAGTASGSTVTHTYKEAGTYTFSYRISYCTPAGEKAIEKIEKLVIKAPASTPTSPTSPSP